jgi:hypothetical protein
MEIEILRREHCAAYLKLWRKKWQETGRYYVMREVVSLTLLQLVVIGSGTAKAVYWLGWKTDGADSIVSVGKCLLSSSKHEETSGAPNLLCNWYRKYWCMNMTIQLSVLPMLRSGVIPPNLHTSSSIMLYHVPHKCHRVNKLRNMRGNKHKYLWDGQQHSTFQHRSRTKSNLIEDLGTGGRIVLNWNFSLDGAERSIWFKIRDQFWAFMEKTMNIQILVTLDNFSIWATKSFWRISPLFAAIP